MDTKAKILQTALDLYNEKGIHTITSRHIAAEMGISAGNLHYHFRHTDDIIIALYEELSAGMDALMAGVEAAASARPKDLLVFAGQSFTVLYKYRFIFLHFPEIGMRIPDIKKKYHVLVKRREKEFIGIFGKWQEKGIFRKGVPEPVLQALVTQIFLVGDYWLAHNELTQRLKSKQAEQAYTNVFQGLFWPYLTEKGMKQL